MPTSVKARSRPDDSRGVQSVEIGTRLLLALAQYGEPMMLKDLAVSADLVPAQAHPYLVSFRQQDMVEQDPVTGRYRLGRFGLELGIARMSGVDLFDVAHRTMRELSNETGLSVMLTVWGSFGPTIVNIIEGANRLYLTSRVGTVYSLSGTASGLIFAAYLPESQLASVKVSEKRSQERAMRVGQPSRLSAADLAAIRKQGFAAPPTPVVPGILEIAAPVFDMGGQLQFAMALIGRGDRNNSAQFDGMRDTVLRHTVELSARLGYIQ
jgi:DNA-binding IclR family transcriptional regulator